MCKKITSCNFKVWSALILREKMVFCVVFYFKWSHKGFCGRCSCPSEGCIQKVVVLKKKRWSDKKILEYFLPSKPNTWNHILPFPAERKTHCCTFSVAYVILISYLWLCAFVSIFSLRRLDLCLSCIVYAFHRQRSFQGRNDEIWNLCCHLTSWNCLCRWQFRQH